MKKDGPIRVLVIDDASVYARVLSGELEQQGGIHAIHVSSETHAVRDQLLQCHPELIVLDLGTRRTDALVLLRKLRENYPVPVIVCSTGAAESAARAVQASQMGALEIMRKPDSGRPTALQPFARELALKIRMAASMARPVPPTPSAQRVTSFRGAGLVPSRYLIVAGASTGGTKALAVLLQHIPADFPPIVIVQHMPVGFTRSFAERLNSECAMSVGEAEDGELLRPGRAVIARGDTHLVVRGNAGGYRAQYTHQQLVNRHCPSVDVLFESAAKAGGHHSIGLLLTGMGSDGAEGLLKLRRAGALTITQDKTSSVVYGMPKVAVDLGASMHSAPPQEMPLTVVRGLQLREQHSASSAGSR